MAVIFQMSNKQYISFLTKKKHAKVLTVCHNKDFSPETSNELIRIENMLLTRTLLFFFPSFLLKCKFYIYLKQSCEGICCLYFNFHCLAHYIIFLKTETWEVS